MSDLKFLEKMLEIEKLKLKYVIKIAKMIKMIKIIEKIEIIESFPRKNKKFEKKIIIKISLVIFSKQTKST